MVKLDVARSLCFDARASVLTICNPLGSRPVGHGVSKLKNKLDGEILFIRIELKDIMPLEPVPHHTGTTAIDMHRSLTN